MATYQEQLEATRRKKDEVAERSFNDVLGWLADGILPFIENGTVTEAQAREIMTSMARSFLDGVAKRP